MLISVSLRPFGKVLGRARSLVHAYILPRLLSQFSIKLSDINLSIRPNSV